jgi:hypothetical protein
MIRMMMETRRRSAVSSWRGEGLKRSRGGRRERLGTRKPGETGDEIAGGEPTAKTVADPTRAYQGQASGVPNLANETATIPASIPTSAADWPTRRVRMPRRKSPSRMPVTNEAIASALFTTLSCSRVAPRATAIRTTPQTAVIARETRSRWTSSVRPLRGRYRSLTIAEADEFSEPDRVLIAAEKIAATTRPRTPVGR